jgi:hypothetical protein
MHERYQIPDRYDDEYTDIDNPETRDQREIIKQQTAVSPMTDSTNGQ